MKVICFVIVMLAIGGYVDTAKPSAPSDFESLKSSTKIHFSSIGIASAPARYGTPPITWECDRIQPVPRDVRSRMRLSSFYRKYLHAFGIPIISSNAPSDQALRRACYVVVFLLADRKDIRTWLYRRNGRAGVVGVREGVTSIPEHSWLPSWWNQRSRGLGGTIQNPISTCGEENLMCASSGDRYPREDIFLHEFTHGIHEIAVAARGAIPDFDGRLRSRYNYLKRSGALWARTYAMSTDREYLAEGTQSYFDVNDEAVPTNGIHNHVNTRPELRSYDPQLFAFVSEVFPCRNKIIKRCEAKVGNLPADRYYFKMDCDKYGKGVLMDFRTKKPVGGGPVTIPPTPKPPPPPQTPLPQTTAPTPPPPQTPPPHTSAPTAPPPQTPPPHTLAPTPPPPQTPPPVPPTTHTPPVSCTDGHRNCGYWAYRGECHRNPKYMRVNCKKSCKVCGGGGSFCVDKHPNCRSWANNNECRKNPAYMRQKCRKSCRIC